jgi:hypothetical protein
MVMPVSVSTYFRRACLCNAELRPPRFRSMREYYQFFQSIQTLRLRTRQMKSNFPQNKTIFS